MAMTASPSTTEADLVAQERQWWQDREWSPAISSFLSRWLFLPLLRLRDGARSRGIATRCLVGIVFYPSYLVALGAWLLMAAVLLALSPLLFLLARAGPRRS